MPWGREKGKGWGECWRSNKAGGLCSWDQVGLSLREERERETCICEAAPACVARSLKGPPGNHVIWRALPPLRQWFKEKQKAHNGVFGNRNPPTHAPGFLLFFFLFSLLLRVSSSHPKLAFREAETVAASKPDLTTAQFHFIWFPFVPFAHALRKDAYLTRESQTHDAVPGSSVSIVFMWY